MAFRRRVGSAHDAKNVARDVFSRSAIKLTSGMAKTVRYVADTCVMKFLSVSFLGLRNGFGKKGHIPGMVTNVDWFCAKRPTDRCL